MVLSNRPFDLPELETLDGVSRRKVSPKRPHSRVQGTIYKMLSDVAEQFGELNIEWRCRPGGVDGSETVLVPDLCFVERSRLDALAESEIDVPPIAPDLVIEIRSPKEHAQWRAEKAQKFLALGTLLVLDVDPAARTIRTVTADGVDEFRCGDTITFAGLPWLSLPVTKAFEKLDRA
jgi:Uma2 family endonuclease